MLQPSISIVPVETALGMSSDITSLYTDVFAAPPWNEAFVCTMCKAMYPLGSNQVVCCGESVKEFYPYPETKSSIESCFRNTRSRIGLILGEAESEKRLAGFAWGWEESFESLNERTLKLPIETFEELRRRCGLEREDPLFYFSEFGVRQELRGRGLGKQMYRELFSSIDLSEARGIVMRTSKQSPAFHVAQTSREYPLKVVYEYRDALERVLLSSLPSHLS